MKFNKIFLGINSLLLLASSLIPGLFKNDATTVTAEETEIVLGKASTYLQKNDKNHFDKSDSDFIESTYQTDKYDDYEIYEYNTDFLDYYIDYLIETYKDNPFVFGTDTFYKSGARGNLLVNCDINDTAVFKLQERSSEGDPFRLVSLFSEKGSLNYEFERIDNSNGQAMPIEFKLDLGNDWFYYFKRILKYCEEDITLPLLEIDGQRILTLEKVDDELSFKSYGGANVHLEYISSDKLNRFIYVEVPYRRHIETISTMFWREYTHIEKGLMNNYGVFYIHSYDFLVQNLFFEKDCYKNSFFSPIIIDSIDFKTGVLSTVSPISSNRYIVDSITINNELDIDCNIRKLNVDGRDIPFDNPIWSKYQQYNLKYNGELFTYNNSNCEFFNKLKGTQEDVDFFITNIKYHISVGKLTPEADDILGGVKDSWNDILDPSSSFDKSQIQAAVNIPNRFTGLSFRASGSETKILDYVIDCKQYYKFKYVDKTTIHTADFDAEMVKNFLSPYTRLYFNAYDNIVNTQIQKLHGLMFYYSLNSEQYKINHSMSFVSDDGIDGLDRGNFFSILKQIFIGDFFHVDKTDKSTGVKFRLQGTTLSDAKAFIMNFKSFCDCPYSFVLYNKGVDIKFTELISFIYINEAGDIINCSGMTWTDDDGILHSGLTAFDDNGNTVIKDILGNDLPLHYDEKTGTLKDEKDKEVEGPGFIPQDQENWFDKIINEIKALFKTGTIYITIIFGSILIVLVIKLVRDIFHDFRRT